MFTCGHITLVYEEISSIELKIKSVLHEHVLTNKIYTDFISNVSNWIYSNNYIIGYFDVIILDWSNERKEKFGFACSSRSYLYHGERMASHIASAFRHLRVNRKWAMFIKPLGLSLLTHFLQQVSNS